MQLRNLLWQLPLLLRAVSAQEEEEETQVTITHTNYVTPYCFEQHLKSYTNDDNHSTGIPLVIVYANPEDPIPSESAGFAPAPGMVGAFTSTTQSPQITAAPGLNSGILNSGNLNSKNLNSVKSSSVGSQKSSSQKSQGISLKASIGSKSFTKQNHQCTVCQTVLLIESALTTYSSTVFTANTTQPITVLSLSSDGLPSATGSDPLVTASTVSGGYSASSDSTSWDISLLYNNTDSTYGQSLASDTYANQSSSASTRASLSLALLYSSYFITSTVSAPQASETDASVSEFSTVLGAVPGEYLGSSSFSRYSNSSSAEPEFGLVSSSAIYGSSSETSSAASSEASSEVSSSEFSSSEGSSSVSSFVSSASTSASASSSSASSSSSEKAASAEDDSYLTIRSVPTCHSVPDLFKKIDTGNPSAYYKDGELPLSIPSGIDTSSPIGTNSFYANLFLGDQKSMVWTYPYGFYWAKDSKYGIAVQHTDPDKRVFGDKNSNGAASYYYNPILLGELIFSSTRASSSNNYMSVTDMTPMSANVRHSPDSVSSDNYVELPLVHGMGFATAIYHGDLKARLATIYAFQSIVKETVASSNDKIIKYRVTLNLGAEWLVFVTLPSRDSDFKLEISGSDLVANKNVDGLIIQAAFAPKDSKSDNYYYESAGLYVTTAQLEGSIQCTAASYKFAYTTKGSSIANKPIVFALPHHLQTLDQSVTSQSTGLELESTVKGTMVGFLTDELSFSETINNQILFLPWVDGMGTSARYSAEQLKLIHETAIKEISGINIPDTILSVKSTYSMGKLADKYAYILYVLNDIVKDEDAAKSLLKSLQKYYSIWFKNTDVGYPLMHDTRFGGVTSTANNDGDTGADFGSGFYNDHHFHYGYHIHASSIIGHVDKQLGGTWAEDNKEQVNILIRDVANPSTNDKYFPVFRLFDWFQGHSWAKGLFASGDGKDEESSSEDYNFYYGMKLWGSIIGDNAMEARGDLILKIMSGAMNSYMLYSDSNDVQPSSIIPNKVSGILFDNKIAYTTYFGQNTEYIHGIHMLPITPASGLIRGANFVKEEWDEVLSDIIGSVKSGWTGILRLNQALFDGEKSYDFFSSDDFRRSYLDDGQSRTWSLAFSAAVANGV